MLQLKWLASYNGMMNNGLNIEYTKNLVTPASDYDGRVSSGSSKLIVRFFAFNHKITPSSTQKTTRLKIRKQRQNDIR